MSSERRYVRLSDWIAIRDFGHEDPGLRPLGDELFLTAEPLPPSSSRVNAITSLRPPDPEARSAQVDTLLTLHGIRPRRR
jgi:hypothetical protein